MVQQTLFGRGPLGLRPVLDGARRISLDHGAWVVHRPGWVRGQDVLFDLLRRSIRWQSGSRRMYERTVSVPRLTAHLPDHGPGPAILHEMSAELSRVFERRLTRIGMAWYRDGRDSVAPHGDRVGLLKDDCIVAIVSLGGPRRFLLRPAGGGRSRSWDLGWGDLFVMGGTCQRTFVHSIPKVAAAEPRISVMFRPALPEKSRMS